MSASVLPGPEGAAEGLADALVLAFSAFSVSPVSARCSAPLEAVDAVAALGAFSGFSAFLAASARSSAPLPVVGAFVGVFLPQSLLATAETSAPWSLSVSVMRAAADTQAPWFFLRSCFLWWCFLWPGSAACSFAVAEAWPDRAPDAAALPNRAINAVSPPAASLALNDICNLQMIDLAGREGACCLLSCSCNRSGRWWRYRG